MRPLGLGLVPHIQLEVARFHIPGLQAAVARKPGPVGRILGLALAVELRRVVEPVLVARFVGKRQLPPLLLLLLPRHSSPLDRIRLLAEFAGLVVAR